jgi:hypothetical protein
MDFVAPFIADGEPAILRKPGQCALHYSSVPSQLLGALYALSCYPALYPALSQGFSALFQGFFALFVVVGFVGVQLLGTLPRSATGTLDGLYSVDELFENRRVVDVGCSKHHTERDASSVRNKVALRALLSFIRRILAGFSAPLWPGRMPSPNKRAPTLSGRLRQDDPKAPGAGAPIPLPLATHAIAAST